ncbi:hypothetical protein TNIN_99621 [Trichonephila inaurata madagascariensis]|uniref:Uncharacterized protein n=1 Tax=Trichonephila inaurata madagascariensis TaxID=2747483 RepID=A0A8X7C0E0_9ARAC|nr:hypothetical protein TNIN_99621 [Trichonephila inaurata madagascariensis]
MPPCRPNVALEFFAEFLRGRQVLPCCCPSGCSSLLTLAYTGQRNRPRRFVLGWPGLIISTNAFFSLLGFNHTRNNVFGEKQSQWRKFYANEEIKGDNELPLPLCGRETPKWMGVLIISFYGFQKVFQVIRPFVRPKSSVFGGP